MNAISTSGLSKSYDGSVYAVRDLNLTVPKGCIFGFLGPNGAGKTTTVKLLGGLLTPTAGSAMVTGFDPAQSPEKVHKVSQLMTENTMMYDHLTATENLFFFGRLFGMADGDISIRAGELLEHVGLTDAKGKLKTFSTGMRQRLSLARVLLTNPKILFLDEPTSGLDPESIQWVNQIIADQASLGATVFLCTHQLRYAEALCTRYGLMDKGRLLAVGNLQQLMDMAGTSHRVRIRAANMPEGLIPRVAANTYECDIADDNDIARIIADITAKGASVYEVIRTRDSLEDLYFKLLKGGDGA